VPSDSTLWHTERTGIPIAPSPAIGTPPLWPQTSGRHPVQLAAPVIGQPAKAGGAGATRPPFAVERNSHIKGRVNRVKWLEVALPPTTIGTPARLLTPFWPGFRNFTGCQLLAACAVRTAP
jgi:hypothetical protein